MSMYFANQAINTYIIISKFIAIHNLYDYYIDMRLVGQVKIIITTS